MRPYIVQVLEWILILDETSKFGLKYTVLCSMTRKMCDCETPLKPVRSAEEWHIKALLHIKDWYSQGETCFW